jgi:hypothetical protein
MSATELIKQVAALPQAERVIFDHLFQEMKEGAGVHAQARSSSWPDFGERLHEIYGDKITPDSVAIIDEGRGQR